MNTINVYSKEDKANYINYLIETFGSSLLAIKAIEELLKVCPIGLEIDLKIIIKMLATPIKNMDDLNAQIYQIAESKKKEIKSLELKYIQGIKKYDVNDVVEDHLGIVKIEKIIVQKEVNGIVPIYHGLELTKSFKPKKSGSRRYVFEQQIKSKKNITF
jgi:hypothetical protein